MRFKGKTSQEEFARLWRECIEREKRSYCILPCLDESTNTWYWLEPVILVQRVLRTKHIVSDVRHYFTFKWVNVEIISRKGKASEGSQN